MSQTSEFRPLWPKPDDSILQTLNQLFESGAWGQYTSEFSDRCEQHLKTLFHRDHAYLVSSGTIAVELALRGVGVQPGDEVILAAYDFPGNFRAIEAIGARAVLVDCLPNHWTIDLNQVASAIGSETKAILVSHLHGHLAPMVELVELGTQTGCAIVEDACQVPGATISGAAVGSFGAASVLSFGGSKLLSSGRGGAVLTNQADVLQRIKIFAERGNLTFPLSELQAAVLLPQLDRLEERTSIRAKAVERLLNRFSHQESATEQVALPMFAPDPFQEGHLPAFYKVPWQVSPSYSRDALEHEMKQAGVPMAAGFRGFARRSSRRCRKIGSLVEAQRAADQTLLLHHPVLLEDETVIDRLALAISNVLGAIRPENGSAGAE